MTKVLLVEDDNNLREIYEARLAAEGYEISTAKDGEDALAVAKQVKPDLIISDVMMPRISGFEMLDILRNTDGLKHAKVIMLTALGQAEDKTRADSLGADRYLVKSQVTLEDIVKAADELLNPDATSDATATSPAANATTTAADTLSPTASPEVAAAAHQTVAVENAPVSPEPASEPMAAPVTPVAVPVQPAPESSTPQPVAVVPEPATDATPTTDIPVAPAPVPQPTPTDPPVQDTESTEPLIQMPPQPVSTESATTTTTQAQSTSQENAAVNQQIENFVNTTPASTPPVDPATQASPVVSTSTTSDDTSNNTVGNEAVIKEAIDNLATEKNQSTPPQPVDPPATSTESEATTTESDQSATTETSPVEPSVNQIPGKKVISPINDLSADKNDLQTLLAQEEMKENLEKGTTGTPVVGDATTSQAPPVATDTPTPSAAPSVDMPGTTPPPGGVFTPNENGNANENAL